MMAASAASLGMQLERDSVLAEQRQERRVATETRKLHVPLPDDLYDRVRAESERSGRPCTTLVREAVAEWVAALDRQALAKCS